MTMTPAHKEALAEGRKQARAIKAYLGALQSRRPGRPASKDSLRERLARIESQIADSTNPLKELELIQTRLDIEDQLASMTDSESLEDLEAEFVKHARAYSERKGITYTAWRQIGVPAAVLRTAGIKETRQRR